VLFLRAGGFAPFVTVPTRSIVWFLAVPLQALEKFNIEKDIAAYIKKEFDKKHSPTCG
jgi:hypothetical protein